MVEDFNQRRYGYGTAVRPKDLETAVRPKDLQNESSGSKRRPLTREVNISPGVLTLYRFFILVRIVVLALFVQWRIKNPNEDAIWLWGMSVVCELWFALSWLLDQLPKLSPVDRLSDPAALKDKFETPSAMNPTGKSDLPGIDIFVSTADPEKEPPLVTANTILSILAVDYPVEKLSCYISDDAGSLLTFEAMAEVAIFARMWVPFCRKHSIEPRNPDSYFNPKRDPYTGKVRTDFVPEQRWIKQKYDKFKVRVNAISDSIQRRSDAFNTMHNDQEPSGNLKILEATWMCERTHWPGTWTIPSPDHSRGDHASILQIMLDPPDSEPVLGTENSNGDNSNIINLSEVDIRLPMLVYVSREKRPGYDHNKKAGAMNALVRSSAIMSNGPFILNLDCDHYINNSQALREGMCFMMDHDGEQLSYVQFPQRFEGIDPSDRYANHNNVFFDVNMRALDGIQGPVYVGTGCLFRRVALYGFEPPRLRKKSATTASASENEYDEEIGQFSIYEKFGSSSMFLDSIKVAESQGLPLADHPSIKNGRPPGALIVPREPVELPAVREAVKVISRWFEDRTEWGINVGWIYGSVTEGVVTGYRMHEKGWRSVYCVTRRDAFLGTVPINLTDRLHQVQRWATGSVEIFFSCNNALLAGCKLKFLQRIAYFNVGIYPFTSIFLIVYCFLPALSLFSGQFIVQTLDVTYLVYLLVITLTFSALAVFEIKWSGINLEEWWRNEQFWLIGGTSAHLAAVLQGPLKVITGIGTSFTLTSKSSGEDDEEGFADLHIKLLSLMIPAITIIMVNLIAIAYGCIHTLYSDIPQWSHLLGGMFFSFWVLAHLYPFAKGLTAQRRGVRTPTMVYVWSGLITITLSFLWVVTKPPTGNSDTGGSSTFPSAFSFFTIYGLWSDK